MADLTSTTPISLLTVILTLIVSLTGATNTTDKNPTTLPPFNATPTVTAALPPPTFMPLSGGNQTVKPVVEYNGTGYYIENDDAEPTGLNDVQTVLLACFATLIPLMVSLFTAFGIKMLWSKYKRRKGSSQYDGIHREGTSESLTRPLHAHLMNKDTSDTNLVIGQEDEEEVACAEAAATSAITTASSKTQSSCSGAGGSTSNGSIITMTLKNNHLIVETEERSDIDEDSRRETTLKYSPSARDGVFVVEVQQGAKRNPAAASPIAVGITEADAVVHNPPDRLANELNDNDNDNDDDDEERIDTSLAESLSSLANSVIAQPIRTGLSQSNTSLSTNDPPSYCYTNQQGYDSGNYGYPVYAGYLNNEPDTKRVTIDQNNTRPKIMAAVYKNPPPNYGQLDDIQLEQNRLGGSEQITQEVELILGGVKEVNNEEAARGGASKNLDSNDSTVGGANDIVGGSNDNLGGASETKNSDFVEAKVKLNDTNEVSLLDKDAVAPAVETNGN